MNSPAEPAAPRDHDGPRGLPVRLLVGAIGLYRLAISPVLPPSCRYWPSCSEYAIESIRGHGALRGGWLAARRLCRCHPWAAGGIDLPPPARTTARHETKGRRAPRRHSLDSSAS